MRKIITILLLISIVLGSVSFSVSAEETITDLTKVHTNLSNYLYTPFYQNSQYFDEYQKVMDEAAELLASDDITQAEISKYYNEIRKAYAQLMQDTYDYSSLKTLLATYDSLDSEIFTEDTWKKLLSIRDSAKKELDSPSLFSKTEKMTEKQYTAYINQHIKSFTNEFQSAFNKLKFKDRPENMTAQYLEGFIKVIRFCARKELLAATAEWSALQNALTDADKLLAKNNPDVKELDKLYDLLLKTYAEACNNAYDFSAAKDTISKYHILSSKSFTKDSWERFSTLEAALEKRLTEPHFFFIPLDADQETCEKYMSSYLSSLPVVVNEAMNSLIPMEDYNKLQKLCEKYKNKTSSEGLDIKLNFLKTRVAEGEDILTNKDSTINDIENAIKNIETAYNDLIVAEGHLIEEQGKLVKQDEKTSRFTIIFYFATFILAAAIAVVLSKTFYGKVNWTR